MDYSYVRATAQRPSHRKSIIVGGPSASLKVRILAAASVSTNDHPRRRPLRRRVAFVLPRQFDGRDFLRPTAGEIHQRAVLGKRPTTEAEERRFDSPRLSPVVYDRSLSVTSAVQKCVNGLPAIIIESAVVHGSEIQSAVPHGWPRQPPQAVTARRRPALFAQSTS